MLRGTQKLIHNPAAWETIGDDLIVADQMTDSKGCPYRIRFSEVMPPLVVPDRLFIQELKGKKEYFPIKPNDKVILAKLAKTSIKKVRTLQVNEKGEDIEVPREFAQEEEQMQVYLILKGRTDSLENFNKSLFMVADTEGAILFLAQPSASQEKLAGTNDNLRISEIGQTIEESEEFATLKVQTNVYNTVWAVLSTVIIGVLSAKELAPNLKIPWIGNLMDP